MTQLAEEHQLARLAMLEKQVLEWAEARNILRGSTWQSQLCKTVEELGELAAGLNKGNKLLIMDGVGDVLVTLILVKAMASPSPLANKPLFCGKKAIVPTKSEHPVLNLLNALDSLLLLNTATYASAFNYDVLYESLLALLAQAAQAGGCTLLDCLEAAYIEIRHRKGRMIGGVFVKESDLPLAAQEAYVPPDHNC